MNNDYNDYVLKRINNLLCQKRKAYKVDLHLHTNYSADGTQDVKSLLCRMKKDFDIISITDHDSIGAYQYVSNLSLDELNSLPIIIPGIELSVYYPQYEGRCHILEYFFDLKNKKFLSNLHRNEFAYWNRAEKQFHRIEYNRCLQFYVKKYNIDYNLTDFKNFLNRTNSIPEYPTIINYIYSYLKDKGVTVWDIFFKLEYYNKKDACLDRKQKIGAKLAEFKKKYLSKNIDYDGNKLMQILAVVGVDDENYINYEPFGSLTVDNYGQIGIFDLVDCGLNIFAHPNHKKLFLINELRDVIDGLEVTVKRTFLN